MRGVDGAAAEAEAGGLAGFECRIGFAVDTEAVRVQAAANETELSYSLKRFLDITGYLVGLVLF